MTQCQRTETSITHQTTRGVKSTLMMESVAADTRKMSGDREWEPQKRDGWLATLCRFGNSRENPTKTKRWVGSVVGLSVMSCLRRNAINTFRIRFWPVGRDNSLLRWNKMSKRFEFPPLKQHLMKSISYKLHKNWGMLGVCVHTKVGLSVVSYLERTWIISFAFTFWPITKVVEQQFDWAEILPLGIS